MLCFNVGFALGKPGPCLVQASLEDQASNETRCASLFFHVDWILIFSLLCTQVLTDAEFLAWLEAGESGTLQHALLTALFWDTGPSQMLSSWLGWRQWSAASLPK